MVQKEVVAHMAEYIKSLFTEMTRVGIDDHVQVNMIAIFVFHQFNGTRNDMNREFNKLMKLLNEGKYDDDKQNNAD